jgi:hypothetical protein
MGLSSKLSTSSQRPSHITLMTLSISPCEMLPAFAVLNLFIRVFQHQSVRSRTRPSRSHCVKMTPSCWETHFRT